MRLRDEANDLRAQFAYEGNDRDEKFDGDMEALGAVDESLEISELRNVLIDAVDAAAQAGGTDEMMILNRAGVLVDQNDEPRVEDLTHEELVRVLRYVCAEHPKVMGDIAERHPAFGDLLTDLAVQNGAGL